LDGKKVIEVKCEGAAYKPIGELIDLQGDLKHLPQEKARKLKASIIKHGFIAPFFVWDNDGVLRLIDGHQRLKVLKAMKEEGWEIPELPVVYINAEDEESAKEKLLQVSSQYGEFDISEIYDFAKSFDMKDFALPSGELELFGQKQNTQKVNTSLYKMYHVLISVPVNKSFELLNALGQIRQIEGVEIEQSAN